MKQTYFRFIDSGEHLPTSLEELVNNLTLRGNDKLRYLHAFVKDKYGDCQTKIDLLSRKGVYPYSYMDSIAKFDEGLHYLPHF